MSMLPALTSGGAVNPSPDAQRIVNLYHQRKQRLAPVHAKMQTIGDQYENLVQVVLPELDKNEVAAVANLISQGVDQMAMRVASTVPSINYPPLRPGIDKSENYARIRRQANYGWWQANNFDRKQRKRSKWLVAYAAAPVVIRPDFKRGIPRWQLTDPLSVFPAACADEDDICPSDGILAYRRTYGWLCENYPQKAAALEMGKDPSPDSEIDVLEYIDAETHCLIAVGRTPEAQTPNPLMGHVQAKTPGLPFIELERFSNRVGRCTLVYPTRPCLRSPISQFDGMPGVYRMQARAMALWFIAAERGIFPETWFESRPNETVDIIERADGVAGVPGRVKGGEMKEVMVAPNPSIGQIIETLERNQRVTAGMSTEFGGEQPTSARTGRAGEQLLSATIDYWIQEAQETLGLAYMEENRLAVAVAKSYFGDTPKSFYVSWKGAKGTVDYVPNVHFENDNNIVSWPQAGSDVNQLVVGLGQRLGLEEISIETAQELDPYIDDPEEENRRLVAQSVNKAFMASVDQAVAAGQVGPTELARFVELVMTGRMDPYKAWQQLHQEAQEQQATQPQPGTPQAMPGLAAPGQQAAQGLPQPSGSAPIPQLGPGPQHMQQLISALHAPAAGG